MYPIKTEEEGGGLNKGINEALHDFARDVVTLSTCPVHFSSKQNFIFLRQLVIVSSCFVLHLWADLNKS